ncbi:MAG: hypothetical protein C4576_06345 [Desulfobacteraceae bacterium]|nr:MAG: hypothetical protein C4576_06345 [Desulfobacteraceae bacterium]
MPCQSRRYLKPISQSYPRYIGLAWGGVPSQIILSRRINPCKSLEQQQPGWSTTGPIEDPCESCRESSTSRGLSSGFKSLAGPAEGCGSGSLNSVPWENTLKSYEAALAAFLAEFTDRQIGEVTTEEILSYLNRVTEGRKSQTRRIRYAHLSAFFNFVRNNLDSEFRNPCDTPAMKRLYRNRAPSRWNTIDKDIIDEVIFKTVKPRDRLMMELIARGGMRVGEVCLPLENLELKGRL